LAFAVGIQPLHDGFYTRFFGARPRVMVCVWWIYDIAVRVTIWFIVYWTPCQWRSLFGVVS